MSELPILCLITTIFMYTGIFQYFNYIIKKGPIFIYINDYLFLKALLMSNVKPEFYYIIDIAVNQMTMLESGFESESPIQFATPNRLSLV